MISVEDAVVERNVGADPADNSRHNSRHKGAREDQTFLHRGPNQSPVPTTTMNSRTAMLA